MRIPPAAVALLLVSTLAVPGHAQTPALRIAEVLPDPETGREFVEIWNSGDTTVALTGWQVQDAAGTTYTFTQGTLDPGARIVLWTGGESDSLGPAWARSAVWNNGGDTATLLAPDTTLVDAFTYGGDIPAPPPGTSLQWDQTWQTGAPTPGTAPGAQTGTVEVTIPNAAPTASLASTPGWARPGSTLRVVPSASDPNGADDLATWSLRLDGTQVANGTGMPGNISVPLPSAEAAQLTLLITDRHGAGANASRSLVLRDSPLLLTSPGDGIAPLALDPAAPATTAAPFRIRNDDAQSRTPLLDVSPLRGPVELPLEGRIEVGWSHNGTTDWVLYEGPLQPLPPIPPESDGELWFRFPAMPEGLPAGAYGLTFTVVA